MNNTPNINLSTYTSDPNDKFNLLVTFNNNMTKIDTAVGAQNDAIDVIEETAGTAVTTANTASVTATEALTTAETKTSVNDNVASATTTYSSNKINELISGIQPGTEIDDSVTSTSKTWSSSKINTEIIAVETVANSKASINDTTAGSTTTYSSNKTDNRYPRNINISNYTTTNGVNTSNYTSKGIYTFTVNPGYYSIQATCSTKNPDVSTLNYVDMTLYLKHNNNTFYYTYVNALKERTTNKIQANVIETPLFYTSETITITVLLDFYDGVDTNVGPSSKSCILRSYPNN